LALTRDKSTIGLAWLSLASGTLRVAEIAPQSLQNELRRIAPAEVLVAEGVVLDGYFTTRLPVWQFDVDAGKRRLLKQLGAGTLAGFGIEGMTPSRVSWTTRVRSIRCCAASPTSSASLRGWR